MIPVAPGGSASDRARLALALIALDPAGLKGIALKARPGPGRDAWLADLARLWQGPGPIRRVTPSLSEDRLIGGLDLAATLAQGRPVAQRGVLAETDQGLLVLAMAERAGPGLLGPLIGALDEGRVRLEREGISTTAPARIGLIALDEGIGDQGAADERLADALSDRLGLWLDLDVADARPDAGPPPVLTRDEIAAARLARDAVALPEAAMGALARLADALAIPSMRALMFACRAARGLAALEGEARVAERHVAVACELVLAPRARAWPADAAEAPPPEPPDDAREDPGDGADPDQVLSEGPLQDRVLEAVRAALPADLLALMARGAGPRKVQRSSGGKAGARRQAPRRGRPVGVVAGDPRRGGRLNLLATLRAAAPWQSLRRDAGTPADAIAVRADDFRLTRYQSRGETLTIFAVDASGSQAMARLGEAKGAVEYLLADCYVRRDHVALIAFRGTGSEVILPPTRSLARAKRALAGLPGGGGTPLALGLVQAGTLAEAARRRGETVTLVVLTDGRANIDRAGQPGRPRAEADALAAARGLRLLGLKALVIDTSARPHPAAAALAESLGARHLALPQADAATLSRIVRIETDAPRRRAS